MRLVAASVVTLAVFGCRGAGELPPVRMADASPSPCDIPPGPPLERLDESPGPEVCIPDDDELYFQVELKVTPQGRVKHIQIPSEVPAAVADCLRRVSKQWQFLVLQGDLCYSDGPGVGMILGSDAFFRSLSPHATRTGPSSKRMRIHGDG